MTAGTSLAPADGPHLRKARGAFFTPSRLSRYVVDWAIRQPNDSVLEPSCGEASFLLAAGHRLAALAAESGSEPPVLHGVEIHERSASEAESVLAAAGYRANVRSDDFFLLQPEPTYDAVVGNPPYIRYQGFSGVARARSQEAALAAGVPLTNLASSWAAFTVHSALFLRPGGRLGLVLPAELMTVNYAAEVRRFLLQRFQSIRLVTFTERVFPGVSAEVILLLADGFDKGPATHCELRQARNLDDLPNAVARTWKPDSERARWTPSLLSPAGLDAYSRHANGPGFTVLHSWGETTLGMVTGNNRYFCLSAQQANELGLQRSDLIDLSPPGSRHLRGLVYTKLTHQRLTNEGSATFLFRPGEPSTAASAYMEHGEELGVHRAYKCRVRSPWWRVPLVPPADLFVTYMNADTPRLCTNRARVYNLNSVHGLYLKPQHRRLGQDLLPIATLNSLTLLGAETVGRAYGGGLLKLEPKEADRLPVPAPQALEAARSRLAAIRPQVAARLRSVGGLRDAVQMVDDVLLVETLGMKRADVRVLRQSYGELSQRRVARGRAARGEG